jgi:RND superfamily putative drug exporter
MRPSNLAARAGRWSARHRRLAILSWIAFVIAATVGGGMIGTNSLDEAQMGNGSSKAADLAVDKAGFRRSSGEQVLLQARSGADAGSAELHQAAAQLAQRLKRTPHVEQVVSPFDAGATGQVSPDGRSALLSFEIAGDDNTAVDRVDPTLAATAAVQRAHPGLRVEQVGSASVEAAFDKSLGDDFQRAETLSVPLTLIILLLAFGALVAAGLPLLLGLTAVGATLGLIGPISQLTPITDQVGSVILLIGLAVGVDYSMFYVRREMEERDRGRNAQAALEAAAATSGHAIVVSGFIVLISMAGMLLSGSSIFVSFGVGTMTVVAVAVIGSLTFLPAMLSWLGEKGWTEKGAVPFVGRLRHRGGGQSRVWGWILDRVLARPWISASLSAALLLALAFPALGMHTMSSGIEGLPSDVPVRGTYDRVQAAFPGTTQPAEVVVQAADVTAPAVRGAIARLREQAVATGRMSEPIDVRVNPARDLAVVEIPLHGTGESRQALASLAALRDDVVPATVGRVAGATVNISGDTAGSKDFNDTMKSHLPIVFGFVLGAAFLLLLFTFRSLVIPLKAIVLNLLSVGASYGVLTLVFQHGWGASLLGFERQDGITSWLPLFLFVVLFGLSMDYHVFIISRIREAVLGGASTDDAVAAGIKSTAGVVTSAAAVMIAVFAIFATLGAIEFKQMGVGLAAAIMIDATLVRAVLLPATMKLLGERNWYLPRGLAWLPRAGQPPVRAGAQAPASSQA